jgi:hypothetical protein
VVHLTTELSLQLARIAIFMLPRVGHMLAPRDPTTLTDFQLSPTLIYFNKARFLGPGRVKKRILIHSLSRITDRDFYD